MTFDLPLLFLVGVAYLSLLFLIAHAADREYIPPRLVRHPLTYALSLGVYATSWTYYGSVGYAQHHGYNFLTIYLGVTLVFLLTPVLLMPILRLTREYQLSSLADLFAFRYRSQLAGVLVTLFMLVGTLPYIALQIRAVTGSARVLTQDVAPQPLALAFCVTITLFAILFGARYTSPRDKHRGLVAAIAFESLIKLLALLAVGLFAVFGVFGGLEAMDAWLDHHPQRLEEMYRPVREGSWSTLLLLAFAAGFLLPRQFHMIFTENISPRSLPTASWGFPLFLLLLTLPVPAILWAGHSLQLTTDADYYVLGITLSSGSPSLALFAFIGGISAASAMVIVTTLALSAMCLNHILLPASYPDPLVDLYRWVIWGRRLLIVVIVAAGYGFYVLLESGQGLVELGLVSFVAVAQFLPGVIGVLYWPRATRYGFIAGLLGGIGIWLLTLVLPLMEQSQLIHLAYDAAVLQERYHLTKWELATFWSLAINALLFAGVSLITKQSEEEQETAQACWSGILRSPTGAMIDTSPAEIEGRLQTVLGADAAAREVAQALRDLAMDAAEVRPGELRRLRERLERNLSGLLGPQLARMTINQGLKLDATAHSALVDTMRYTEERLEASRNRLRGVLAELDALRRYHRQVLLDLPLGVCSLSPDREIIIWNMAMEDLSGVPQREALGISIDYLPEPWRGMLRSFVEARDHHLHKLRIDARGSTRCYNLHKAAIGDLTLDNAPLRSGLVVLIEDLSDIELLESELAHSERLASIGRLAAGVAHEIGNPLTGITSLAQNLRHEDDPRIVDDSLEQILEQTRRIAAIVRLLRTFSHGGIEGPEGEPHDDPVYLSPLIDDAIRFARLSNSAKDMTCSSSCPRELIVRGNGQRLRQVFVNLLSNACDASRPGDRIDVLCERHGDWVAVSVVDQGVGIPEAIRDRVLEPFFTTKQPGEGTGLGLPIVYRIVRDHGGTLTLEPNPLGPNPSGRPGTRVTVRLPHYPQGRAELQP